MHDLTLLVTPEDIDDQIAALWRTDLFRAAHRRADSLVRRTVDRFASAPRILHRIDDARDEPHHFTPWFNTVARPDLTGDPARDDLRLLRRLFYASAMRPDPAGSWERFRAALFTAEIDAAVLVEAGILIEMPELRSTFDGPIWADHYLSLATPEKRDAFMGHIRCERLTALCGWDPANPASLRIERRRRLTHALAEIWKARRQIVESRMRDFYARAAKDRKGALDEHAEWLEGMKEGGTVPFAEEAAAFADAIRRAPEEERARIEKRRHDEEAAAAAQAAAAEAAEVAAADAATGVQETTAV